MKALILLVLWLGAGLAVSLHGSRPAWERVLTLLFWPFFLAAAFSGPAPVRSEPAPVARLRGSLAPDDPAQALVGELAAALRRQQERVARLEQALAGAGPGGGGDPALEQARARSRQLLEDARAREQTTLGEALAAIEEAATRLWLLRESGERGEVEALLQGLTARLRAGEEVQAAAGEASAG